MSTPADTPQGVRNIPRITFTFGLASYERRSGQMSLGTKAYTVAVRVADAGDINNS